MQPITLLGGPYSGRQILLKENLETIIMPTLKEMHVLKLNFDKTFVSENIIYFVYKKELYKDKKQNSQNFLVWEDFEKENTIKELTRLGLLDENECLKDYLERL